MSYQVLEGSCIDHMREMADESIDAIVCDPPYDLTTAKRYGPGQKATKGPPQFRRMTGGFLGKSWDATGIAFDTDMWAEAYRVLKPGGHVLAFGGTRTSHRMTCAIEDAGFEIRDSIHWIYGSGFPKSLNIAIACEQQLCERVEIKPKVFEWHYRDDGAPMTRQAPFRHPLANQWAGYGTALKPAVEPVVMARKPLSGTVIDNVEEYGTGALNIDGCRITTSDALEGGSHKLWSHYRDGKEPSHVPQSNPANRQGIVGRDMGFSNGTEEQMHAAQAASIERMESQGRWPANVIFDEEAAAVLDRQVGVSSSSPSKRNRLLRQDETQWRMGGARFNDTTEYSDSGGPSRFFYVAKASRSEREAGLEELETQTRNRVNPGGIENDPKWAPTQARNQHPCVKPIALMRYLVKLVTPPDGTVYDPFCGSGTTGCAALKEGFNFIGSELTPEYVPIALARIAHAEKFEVEKTQIKAPTIEVKGTTFTQSILPGVQ